MFSVWFAREPEIQISILLSLICGMFESSSLVVSSGIVPHSVKTQYSFRLHIYYSNILDWIFEYLAHTGPRRRNPSCRTNKTPQKVRGQRL